MLVFEWKIWISTEISLIFVPESLIDGVIMGLAKGLAKKRRQNIIWTNDSLAYWRMYVSPDELILDSLLF